MPSPPEFVIRACAVLSCGEDALLSPELLRRAKRDDESGGDLEQEEERRILSTCLVRHLKGTQDERRGFNEDENSVLISSREVGELLREAGYRNWFEWDNRPRNRLMALCWVAIQRQVWRCYSAQEHLKLLGMGACPLAPLATDLESDVIRACFSQVPSSASVAASSLSSSATKHKASTSMVDKVRAGPTVTTEAGRGSGGRGDGGIGGGNKSGRWKGVPLDLSGISFSNHSHNSSHYHSAVSGSHGSAYSDDVVTTCDDIVSQYGRIQHKLRLLKDLEKKRVSLVAGIAKETQMRAEAARNDAGAMSATGTGAEGVKGVKDVRAALAVAALATTVHINMEHTVANGRPGVECGGGDGGNDDGRDRDVDDFRRCRKGDPLAILDAERKHVSRLEAQLAHDRKMEAQFWAWIASGAQEAAAKGNIIDQGTETRVGGSGTEDDTSIELSTSLAEALVPAVAGVDALLYEIVAAGRLDATTASRCMDEEDLALSQRGVPMEAVSQRIKTVREFTAGRSPLGPYKNVLESALQHALRSAQTKHSDAALTDLREKNRSVLTRVLAACEASLPYQVVPVGRKKQQT